MKLNWWDYCLKKVIKDFERCALVLIFQGLIIYQEWTTIREHMAEVLKKITFSVQSSFSTSPALGNTKMPCIFGRVHSSKSTCSYLSIAVRCPFGDKESWGVWSFRNWASWTSLNVRPNCILKVSQWIISDVNRDGPGQRGVRNEEVTHHLSHEVSCRPISTDVVFLSLNLWFDEHEAMKEHEDLQGRRECWRNSSRCFWPGVANGSMFEVLPTCKVADGNPL